MQDPKTPARRPIPARRPAPRTSASVAPPPPARPAPRFRAEAPIVDFDDVLGTEMFETLAKLRAVPVDTAAKELSPTGLREVRGYATADLYALAEIAYHYLFSGGHRIALTIFEGLAAIAPEEPYFALALGLSFDRLDKSAEARTAYARAIALDPKDPRPEINLAELELEAEELKSARARLGRAAEKARATGDSALLAKAQALSARLGLQKGA
ncbi:MAG: hypothetical protein U1E65_08175 [Myxococcota bacterium]